MTSTGNIAVNRDFVVAEQNILKQSADLLKDLYRFQLASVDDGNDQFKMGLAEEIKKIRGVMNTKLTTQQAACLSAVKKLQNMLDHWDEVEEGNRKQADFYEWYMA